MPRESTSTESDALELLGLPSATDLWGLMWRRKSLIGLGMVVGLVMGSLYYARTTPIYESAAEILVIQKRPEAVTGDQQGSSHF